jgi:uncharacterized protein (DUF1800 family)
VNPEALTRRSLLSLDLGRPPERTAPDPLVHLVNRITFGVCPRDLARARELGFEGFVEEQLHPEAIDDAETEAAVRARFPTVGMGRRALERHERLRVVAELKAATVYRAVSSRRQLLEMMVDFWSNHFNVHHLDGPVAYFKTLEDREVIRPSAFGIFRQLLGASAKSPAMIIYLDNFSNLKSSPNENYGRELLELHTIGVDSGFTDVDVQEVARAFTGWTLIKPAGGRSRRDRFLFDPEQHDEGARTVLGTEIPAGLGLGHGERVLDLLAGHPACARFVAAKLCRRFVADAPPPALVDRAAATFTATGGDVREVLRVILLSGEFRNSAGRKLKRPLEVVVSALRTLEARLSALGMETLLSVLFSMGQLPFDWPPPNGYPDVAEAWGNANGMLDRWNLALALGWNQLPGVAADIDGLASGPRQPAALADHLAERLLGRPLTGMSRRQLIRHLEDGGAISGAVALILASPEHQWR